MSQSDFVDDLHQSLGVLRYGQYDDGSHKLVVEVDSQIASYYRSLIPKYHVCNPQKYSPHISVVRNEVPVNLEHWGKYDGEPIAFNYSGQIRRGTVYWWLNVFCVRLEEIRLELGLPVSSQYTLPPDGFTKCFHLTLGNSKDRK